MNCEDIEAYKDLLEKAFDKRNKTTKLPDIRIQYFNEGIGESIFCSKNILKLEDFDNKKKILEKLWVYILRLINIKVWIGLTLKMFMKIM